MILGLHICMYVKYKYIGCHQILNIIIFHFKIELRVREQSCGPYWTVHMVGDFISNFQFSRLVFMDPEYTLQHWR